MKLCKVKHYLDPLKVTVIETYTPDALVEMFTKQGIEAEVVIDDNYLPAHLKSQAI